MKVKVVAFLACILISSGLFAQDNPYQDRLNRIYKLIGDGTAIIQNSGRDYVLPGEINMNYYYLTGDDVANSILILSGVKKEAKIFRTSTANSFRRAESEVNGIKVGKLEELRSFIYAGRSFASDTWFVDFNAWPDFTKLGLTPAGNLKHLTNLSEEIYGMRKIKDAHEMELLTHAIETTAAGLVEVMKAAEPGMNEKDFELILKYRFEKAGCEQLGFGIQAASGPNSTSVHYGANDRTTVAGDMMVFDVGARYGYYSADISRSFPVSGKFTKEQKEIYSLVLAAQKAAIREMKPGVNIQVASQAATDELNAGLARLGLITDLNSEWQKRFWIQHGFFHHIGLVVHDVGGYNTDLEPGMIITMEPGMYFPENYLEQAAGYRLGNVTEAERDAFLKAVTPIFKKYINIGVRIEDDVYITEDGNRIISAGVPKEIDEIEKLMKERSMFNQ